MRSASTGARPGSSAHAASLPWETSSRCNHEAKRPREATASTGPRSPAAPVAHEAEEGQTVVQLKLYTHQGEDRPRSRNQAENTRASNLHDVTSGHHATSATPGAMSLSWHSKLAGLRPKRRRGWRAPQSRTGSAGLSPPRRNSASSATSLAHRVVTRPSKGAPLTMVAPAGVHSPLPKAGSIGSLLPGRTSGLGQRVAVLIAAKSRLPGLVGNFRPATRPIASKRVVLRHR